MIDQIGEYKQRYENYLQTIAENIENLLREFLTGTPRIDRITARAKEPEKFAEKANRKNPDGTLKYNAPLSEIQDQIGARVIVFYKNDVQPVVNIIERYIRYIEEEEKAPESLWEFGYFGRHLILALPRDVIPQGIEIKKVPNFFELQIKTLFQHAWSESNHDLGYKPGKLLNTNQKRRLAFTAAQAWGADQVFQDLWVELQDMEQ